MNAQLTTIAAVVAFAAPAFAQFSFDATTGTCAGLNAGVRGPCGDLRGQNLEGANLSGLDLRGARFDGVNLKHASLMRARLQGASFQNADLTGAVLSDARLDGAQLSGARLVAARLQWAVLSHAVLTGANLRNACLVGAQFDGADLRTAEFSRTRGAVDGALWGKALVSIATLPYDASELAARDVQVSAVELSQR